MTSTKLAERRAANAKAASEAELAELAAHLDAGLSAEDRDDMASEQVFFDGEGDDTTEITDLLTLDEAVELHKQSQVTETPYANIINALKSQLRPAVSVVTGELGTPAFINTNPQPVRTGSAPSVDRSNRIKVVGRKGNVRKDVGNFDIVLLAPSHRDAADTVLVNALLDRINPEFVMHGGANGADAMARTWCHSRQVEQAEFVPNWGDGPTTDNPGLGTAAGPMRNQVMLDMADELQEEHGKRVVIFTFTFNDNQGRDRITQSMVRSVVQRNAIKQEEVSERQYMIPVFEASEWLNDDFRASLPVSTRGKVLEYEMPLVRS
jgi:hypothetical protein